MVESDPPDIMILGCGRSGTSIFGELFEHLTPYHYLSEPDYEMLLVDSTGPRVIRQAQKDPMIFV